MIHVTKFKFLNVDLHIKKGFISIVLQLKYNTISCLLSLIHTGR
jgi:hypothetical protein